MIKGADSLCRLFVEFLNRVFQFQHKSAGIFRQVVLDIHAVLDFGHTFLQAFYHAVLALPISDHRVKGRDALVEAADSPVVRH